MPPAVAAVLHLSLATFTAAQANVTNGQSTGEPVGKLRHIAHFHTLATFSSDVRFTSKFLRNFGSGGEGGQWTAKQVVPLTDQLHSVFSQVPFLEYVYAMVGRFRPSLPVTEFADRVTVVLHHLEAMKLSCRL